MDDRTVAMVFAGARLLETSSRRMEQSLQRRTRATVKWQVQRAGLRAARPLETAAVVMVAVVGVGALYVAGRRHRGQLLSARSGGEQDLVRAVAPGDEPDRG